MIKGNDVIIDNDVVFKKIVPEKKHFSWFGYNISLGKWLLTFDIKSDIEKIKKKIK